MLAMKKQPLILLVDDDQDTRETMKAVVETRRYRLVTARDGQQALARVQDEPPDLILLDMLMPRMDGFAVVKELRSDPRYAGIPVVVLTTVLEDAAYRRYELETGRKMEVQAYLEKPTPPAELLHLVASMVDQPYIVVADDDPDILEAMSTVLRSGPYRVATARDGETALGPVRQPPPRSPCRRGARWRRRDRRHPGQSRPGRAGFPRLPGRVALGDRRPHGAARQDLPHQPLRHVHHQP